MKTTLSNFRRTLSLAILASLTWLMPQVIMATNTSQTVTQVTQAVTLSADVDYHISSTTPFATAGSINITNTDHAVVIFDALKPSVAKSYLSNIYINGAKAVNGTNCQLKLHAAQGSILLPYGDDVKMLTVYTEQGFQGDSCNDYTTGNNGGYMLSLTQAKLNNQIRSFRLKRGYMVTFAIGQSGYGYNRCFIAQDADLEVSELPTILDKRISSYRIFKWQDAGKNGVCNGNETLANDMNEALNTSWSFSWYWSSVGGSQLPDRDFVVHQYKEYTPHTDALGAQDWTCHMKTNNEPANKSDEGDCSVSDVLANWENKMRTGLRLCSPSQHDGGLSWTQQFFDSIDARGWRCDIVDIHCYWPEWNLLNQVAGYYTKYQRPIWISEFIWGASWNKNGIFIDGKTDTDNYNVMSNVLNNWNNLDCVERYAYWNAESKGHIYENGSLTQLGEFYSKMVTGTGYKADYEFVPVAANWPITASYNLTGTYTPAKSTCTLKWADDNYDLLNSMVVQRRLGTSGTWEDIASITLKDANKASYQYIDTLDETGIYYYRIHTVSFTNRQYYSNEASVTKSGTSGNDTFQFGEFTVNDISQPVNVQYTTKYDSKPLVFMGLITNKNVNTQTSPFFKSNSITTSSFNYIGEPWAQQTDGTTTYTKAENIPFLVMPAGNYTWGDMTAEAALVKVKSDTTRVNFTVPFPEGVTPVVIATMNVLSSNTYGPSICKVWDIDNTGFSATVQYEEATGRKIVVNQQMAYLAVTPGTGVVDEENGIYVAAGLGSTRLYSTQRAVYFESTTEEAVTDTILMDSPLIFGQLQTANTTVPTTLRISSERTRSIEDSDGNSTSYTYGAYIKRIVDTSVTAKSVSDKSATADYAGWFAISTSKYGTTTAITSPTATPQSNQLKVNVSPNRTISVAGQSNFKVYTMGGMSVNPNKPLPQGIYLVRANGVAQKVVVK